MSLIVSPTGKRMKASDISAATWNKLAKLAWAARSNARILDDTKVGSALITANGKIFSGCNVEHSLKSHDIHSETNTISTMIANGERKIIAIVVVSHREHLTPCGSCMDWIFEFGGPDCLVGVFSKKKNMTLYRAVELMPYYPY